MLFFPIQRFKIKPLYLQKYCLVHSFHVQICFFYLTFWSVLNMTLYVYFLHIYNMWMTQKINYHYLSVMLIICHFISVKLDIVSVMVCRVYSFINDGSFSGILIGCRFGHVMQPGSGPFLVKDRKAQNICGWCGCVILEWRSSAVLDCFRPLCRIARRSKYILWRRCWAPLLRRGTRSPSWRCSGPA